MIDTFLSSSRSLIIMVDFGHLQFHHPRGLLMAVNSFNHFVLHGFVSRNCSSPQHGGCMFSSLPYSTFIKYFYKIACLLVKSVSLLCAGYLRGIGVASPFQRYKMHCRFPHGLYVHSWDCCQIVNAFKIWVLEEIIPLIKVGRYCFKLVTITAVGHFDVFISPAVMIFHCMWFRIFLLRISDLATIFITFWNPVIHQLWRSCGHQVVIMVQYRWLFLMLQLLLGSLAYLPLENIFFFCWIGWILENACFRWRTDFWSSTLQLSCYAWELTLIYCAVSICSIPCLLSPSVTAFNKGQLNLITKVQPHHFHLWTFSFLYFPSSDVTIPQ